MRVYIAGPMRSKPAHNRPMFAEVRAYLERCGHDVFCPASVSAAMPFGPDHDYERTALNLVATLDVALVLASDVVVLLPEWQTSKGATMEVAVARFAEISVMEYVPASEDKPARLKGCGANATPHAALADTQARLETFVKAEMERNIRSTGYPVTDCPFCGGTARDEADNVCRHCSFGSGIFPEGAVYRNSAGEAYDPQPEPTKAGNPAKATPDCVCSNCGNLHAS